MNVYKMHGEKKLDETYSKMLLAVKNRSRKQQPKTR